MVARQPSSFRCGEKNSHTIEERTRALLAYTEKLTRSSASMCEKDVEELRRCGYSDRAILDAVQVTAYFHYINRIADGLGVDLEPKYPPSKRSRTGSS